jgi:hypothetical protein
MAHLITILRLVGGAGITEWQQRATGNALKFTTSGHVLLHVCMHGEAWGKAFSKSGEETAEGSDFGDTSSDTSNSPSPAAAAASSQGVAQQCHFGVRAFNKARRSLNKLGWYSLDRSARVPMVAVRENTHSLIHVFDTLSGKQAVDDRNSWARIHQCKESFTSCHGAGSFHGGCWTTSVEGWVAASGASHAC